MKMIAWTADCHVYILAVLIIALLIGIVIAAKKKCFQKISEN